MTDINAVVQVTEDPTGVAVRRGAFFGSPQCCHARLCTLAAYEQAIEEGRRLVAHLGPGWTLRVWENLGWFYAASLQSGDHFVEVHPRTIGSSTTGGWKIDGYGATFDNRSWHDSPTPEGAIIKVIAEMRAEMDNLGAVLLVAMAVPAIAEVIS